MEGKGIIQKATTIGILPEIAKKQHEKYKKELLQVLDLQTSDIIVTYYKQKGTSIVDNKNVYLLK